MGDMTALKDADNDLTHIVWVIHMPAQDYRKSIQSYLNQDILENIPVLKLRRENSYSSLKT